MIKIWKWYIINDHEVAAVEKLAVDLGKLTRNFEWLQDFIKDNPELIANTDWPRPNAQLTRRLEDVYDDELEILR